MTKTPLAVESIREIEIPLIETLNDEFCSNSAMLSVNMQKTATIVDDCYDSLSNLDSENFTPFSKINEFKVYGGYTLEDLDTNVDTTSIPESEVVSEYFDIYSTNESLDKIYSLDSISQKWDFDYSPNISDQTTKSDDTTIVESFNNELSNVEQDLTPFCEDEFRYVTCRWKSIYKSSSNTYDIESQSKNECVECSENINLRNKRKYSNIGLYNGISSEKKTHLLQTSNDSKGSKQLILENNALITLSVPILENSFHFIPTLSHKCAKLVSQHPINTNYCVYVGADYNKLVCSCDMGHHKGSNSHSTSCKVVVGGIELSTESWPVSRASKLYLSVNNWDRRLNKYHKSAGNIVKDNFNGHNSKDNFCLLYKHKHDDVKIQQRIEPCPCTSPDGEPMSICDIHIDKYKDELLKIGNILISEITGIKMKDEPKINQEKEIFSETPKKTPTEGHKDTGKRRRLYKQKSLVNLSETTKFVSDNDVESKTFDVQSSNGSESGNDVPDHRLRTCKHELNNNNEKVSGVWYDTNRHLWRVVYMKGNKRKTQGFSTLKLGYEEARRKAIQLRHEMVALYQNDKF